MRSKFVVASAPFVTVVLSGVLAQRKSIEGSNSTATNEERLQILTVVLLRL
jgi:hypothetical protein